MNALGFFYYAFSGVGVAVVMIVSLLGLLGLLIHTILSDGNKALRMGIGIAVFLVVQTAAFMILLHDFPEPSVVDLTPIEALGGARITNFEVRQAALENTRYFLRKNAVAYNYYFEYWNKPSLELNLYVMDDAEEAYRNLLVAAGDGADTVRRLENGNSVYLSDARYWRGRNSFFSEDFAREVDLCFTIDHYLFVLRERGSGAPPGSTVNEVVALVLETFLNE